MPMCGLKRGRNCWRPAMSRLLRILPAFALLLAAASAHSQYYNPAEQEMLRNARLALLPNYFHNAAAFGNVEMVRKFLATGVRVDLRDREGRTMLMLSVETSVLANQPEAKRAEMLRGKIAAAQALLERGADPRLKSNGGFTVLHTAAHLGEFAPLMEPFIAKGADVNALDTWGGTAMFTAVYPNDSGPIEVLLRHGADPNARDLKKWTAL